MRGEVIAVSLAAILFIPPAGHAVIVDRVAIAIGTNQAITQSEIDERIRLTAFQNGRQPDLSLASRREAARQLIDQRLVEREMDVGHYPRLAATRGVALVEDYARDNFAGDVAAMERALASYGLTTKELEEDLVRQADLLTFLNLRFRPGNQSAARQSGKSDSELDAWLADQRKRIRIEYIDKDLVEANR